MRTLYFLLTVTFFTLIFPTNHIEAQNTGSIEGYVTNSTTNEAIEFVEIIIPEIFVGTTTNKDGFYSIKNIPTGIYNIKYKMLGFIDQIVENVKIESDKNQKISIELVSEEFNINEITVSATKISKTIKHIGSPIYVIGEENMEQTEGRNIEESLSTIPGVFTENRFNGGSNVVSFRGIGLHTHVTRGILVLVDGVPINETSGRTSFEGVDMENAERVEVIKGPVSSLYGPNGITGVINIIEKEPEPGFNGNVDTYYGSYDTRKIAANINGGNDKIKYLIKSGYIYSGGYLDRQVYDSKFAGIKLINNTEKVGKIGFTADYVHSYSEYAGPLDSTQFVEKSTVATNNYTGSIKDLFRLNLNHSKQINSNTDIFSSVYYRKRLDDGHYRDSQFGEDDIDMIGGEIRFKTTFSIFNKDNTLSVGVSADRENGSEELYARDITNGEIGELIDDGVSNYTLGGIYLQDEYFLFNKFILTLGIRYDYVQYDWKDKFNTGDDNTSDEGTITAFSPKFGFVYNPISNLTVFGNMAKGFNPPQISQLYIGSSYSGLPNPNLKPEYITNYELGLRGSLTEKINYQASIFRMDFEDQIVAEGDPLTYENIGDTKHSGIEAAINYKLNDQLSGHISYSWLNTEFVNYPEYNGNALRKTPENQLNTRIQYKFKFGLTASVDYIFMDEYYMDNEEVNLYDGHSLVNSKLIYRIKNYYFSLRVNNIFNTNYATWAYASSSYNFVTGTSSWEKSYYPGLPRNYTFSFGFNF